MYLFLIALWLRDSSTKTVFGQMLACGDDVEELEELFKAKKSLLYSNKSREVMFNSLPA